MISVEIVEWTRGHITVEVGDRRLKIQGEGHPGPTGFLIYADTIRGWEPPHDGEPLDTAQKKEILDALLRELDASGRSYTVEGEPS